MSVLLWFLLTYLVVGAVIAGLEFWRGAHLGEALFYGVVWPVITFIYCVVLWMEWRANAKRKG